MNDFNSKFSICIPCYDDLGGLRETLNSVLKQLDSDKEGQFYIVIGLNDCRFSEKDALDGQPSNKGVRLRFFKTEKYLEYDASIKFVLSKVKTDFCLLIGCGERVLPNFSHALLTFQDNQLDFGLLTVWHQKKGGSLKKPHTHGVWSGIPLGKFNKMVSGHLFRTEFLQNLLSTNSLITLEWAHIEIALLVQSESRNEAVGYEEPTIVRFDEEQGWWSGVDIYKQYIEYCDLLLTYNERYPKLVYVKKELKKAYWIRLLLMILQARSNGLREAPLFFRDWINLNCKGRFHRLVMTSALWTPAKMAAAFMVLANWILKFKKR